MKQFNNEKSFTLVEFLVVIFIIGIFSLIIFPNYRSAQQQLALQRSASKLAQDIRRAQEMAMAMEELSTGDLPEGYGVYFEQLGGTDYIAKIYADTGPPTERRDPGGGEDIEDISMEEKEVYISDVNTDPKKVSINFKPPDPEITMKWDAGSIDEVEITLSLKVDPTKTKIIKVNEAGLIYVE